MFFESFCVPSPGKIGDRPACERIDAAKSCNMLFPNLLAVNKRLPAFLSPSRRKRGGIAQRKFVLKQHNGILLFSAFGYFFL